MRPSAREGSFWARLSRASREMPRRDDRGTSDSGYGMSNIVIFTVAAAGGALPGVPPGGLPWPPHGWRPDPDP